MANKKKRKRKYTPKATGNYWKKWVVKSPDGERLWQHTGEGREIWLEWWLGNHPQATWLEGMAAYKEWCSRD